MSAYKVELSNCDKEPIHIPGKVQSHGFLIAVNKNSHLISHLSENIGSFINEEASIFLGKPMDLLEEKLAITALPLKLSQIYILANSNKEGETLNPFYLELGQKPYNLIVTLSENEQIMEFEPEFSGLTLDLQRTISRSVSGILSGKNLNALLQNAAEEVKNIIGYDRVMIYKFGGDGHGEVVSEAKNKDLDPFLGLHYPASDIPQQARELYKIKLTRIIADVSTQSSPIITHNREDQPLDLTHSELRAVSPIHIQYLKNMGVASSFSISLVVNQQLWGLIACHNYTPRFINYKARDASKLIGQILSSALEYKQEEELITTSAAYNMAVNDLTGYIEKEDDLTQALTGHKSTIRDLTSATGAALLFDHKITRIGVTPDDEQITAMVQWLTLNTTEPVYADHRLPETFHPSKEYSQTASGLLACRLSKEMNEWILWFKPEQTAQITWAGDPAKPVLEQIDELLTISPRRSFEKWTEMVSNTAEKWSSGEIATVVKIREQIIYTINRKANEIRLLNDRLELAYEELDTFSYTISHDLRSPLSSIRSYSELLSTNNKSLDEQARKIIERIIFSTDKMNHLIREILNYSKMGRVDLELSPIDMGSLLQEIRTEVLNDLQPKNLEFVMGDTPSIRGDAVMINQVFTNLVNNAIKYSARSNPARVKVEGVLNNNEIIYSISDNGVGIDIKYYSRVFELFKRLDNVKDFEGTGVGLAIVKRIVERHNARIWFESQLGVGTIFYLAFSA